MTPRRTTARSAAPIALVVLALMVGLVVASSVTRAGPEGVGRGRCPRPPTPRRPAPSDDGGARADDDRRARPCPSSRWSVTRWPTRRRRPSTPPSAPRAWTRSSGWRPGGGSRSGGWTARSARGWTRRSSSGRPRPTVWVVQLGTNDIAAEPLDRARYQELVTTMLDTIGADVPVVWVNVHRDDRPEAQPGLRRHAAPRRPDVAAT